MNGEKERLMLCQPRHVIFANGSTGKRIVIRGGFIVRCVRIEEAEENYYM